MRLIARRSARILLLLCAAAPACQRAQEPATATARLMDDGTQEVHLKISGATYSPATIQVVKDRPLRMRIVRDEKPSCGDVLLIPSQNIRRDIPVQKETVVEFTPRQSGTIDFVCGMHMMKGRIVVP